VKGYARKCDYCGKAVWCEDAETLPADWCSLDVSWVHTLDYCCLSCLDEAVALSLEDAEHGHTSTPWYSLTKLGVNALVSARVEIESEAEVGV